MHHLARKRPGHLDGSHGAFISYAAVPLLCICSSIASRAAVSSGASGAASQAPRWGYLRSESRKLSRKRCSPSTYRQSMRLRAISSSSISSVKFGHSARMSASAWARLTQNCRARRPMRCRSARKQAANAGSGSLASAWSQAAHASLSLPAALRRAISGGSP